MTRKKYVSANTKYYKNSQVSGVTGHVNRVFAENKNAFAEHSHLNFGDADLFGKYRQLFKRKEELTGKQTRKDATTYCETVLAFSREQYDLIEAQALKRAENDPTKAHELIKKVFSDCLKDYQEQIQTRFGLTPVGFNMHLDEGHICKETGELKRNIHAHAGFFNYDFEKGVSPWRKMGKKQLSEMQDIADQCFKRLGFERGVKATETKKKHLEKDEFIAEKQRKQLEELKAVDVKKKRYFKRIKEKQQQQLEEINRLEEKHLSELELIHQEEMKLEDLQRKKEQIQNEYMAEASAPIKALQRFLSYALNYLSDFFNGTVSPSQKKKYEQQKEELEKFEYTPEQRLIIDDTARLVEEQTNPKKYIQKKLKR